MPLRKIIPDIVLDLRYETKNNFTHTVLYRHPVACLREIPANNLRMVQEELRKTGLGIKLFDAFRPFSVSCT
ncbi:MAG: M15 family metallopeptidase, partial [Bacteroidia bacterium]